MVVSDIKKDIDYLEGITDVYKATREKGFETSEKHPLAWEVIFQNNEVGKSFTLHLLQTFDKFPEERGCIVDLEGEASDVARCVTCAFKDADAFRHILKESMEGKAIYDEREKRVIPRTELIDRAKEVVSSKEMAIA